jgi:hypothetical protein
MRLRSRDGTIARLVSMRNALENGYSELEGRLWANERRLAEFTRNDDED